MTGKVCKVCRAQVACVDGSELDWSRLSFLKFWKSRQRLPQKTKTVRHEESLESLQVKSKITFFIMDCN